MKIDDLIKKAAKVRDNASAKYSGFNVGAALEDADGNIFTGCNVESSSYGLSVCAERVALFKALSEGSTKFIRIAIVAVGEGLVPPCGACRQLLQDYAKGIEVILYDPVKDRMKVYYLSDLFPYPFDENKMSGINI